MDRTVYIDTIGDQVRRLVTEAGRPVEYAVQYGDSTRIVGNVYAGRVQNILPGMHAAFVDIGLAKHAFLSLDDVPPVVKTFGEAVSLQAKTTAVTPGQICIVQVTKQPDGEKGPRVTMNLSLPGEMLVLLPTIAFVGVSRHIGNAEERSRLQAAGEALLNENQVGWVLRTAAKGVESVRLREEANALLCLWGTMRQWGHTAKKPRLLFREGDLIERAERDFQLPVHHGPFSEEMETALQKALQHKIWLRHGGQLVIDTCEAMTVVDVNSGKFTGKRNLRETLLKLNKEAAVEIARLIRLRDIGGIIVIDFIDMECEEDRESVLTVFLDAMQSDRAKHHVHGFTKSGLLELTRRPIYQPVLDALYVPCACCQGMGKTVRPQVRAHDMLLSLRKRHDQGDIASVDWQVPDPLFTILSKLTLPPNVTLTKGEPHEAISAPDPNR